MAACVRQTYHQVMAKVLFIIAVIGVMIFAIIDLFCVPADDVRGRSRLLWLVGILFLPLIGAVAWLLAGRAPQPDSRPRILPPDDDPDFLRGMDSP